MSNLSKKDFAQLCGMDTKKLAVYIKRRKVTVEKTGFIDTKNEVNALFIAKNNAEKPTKSEKTDKKTSKRKANDDEIDIDLNKLELIGLDKEKKKADLRKSEVEFQISLLKKEKLMGTTMPIEMVKSIISNLSKAFIGEFKNGANEIIRVLEKSKDYSHTEVSELRGSLSSIINEAMKKSISNAKKDMKTVAENYSETRGVGEHD